MLNYLLEDVLSKRKCLISEWFLGETNHIGGLFSIRGFQEPLQNITWSTFQQDLTASRCYLLLQRAPSFHVAGVLKPHLVTNANGDRDH